MNEQFEHTVYSKNVIEFVTVCIEFCNWLENSKIENKKNFEWKALKILPLLYLKTSVLIKPDLVLDDFLEKFVSEADYEYIRNKVKTIMGKYDDYLEVFTNDINFSETPLVATISENIADIYQDIKDFLFNYRTAVTEIMNDALSEIVTQFETYWGQRLVNVLRAIHQTHYGNADGEDNGNTN
jgi:hypothetical protein